MNTITNNSNQPFWGRLNALKSKDISGFNSISGVDLGRLGSEAARQINGESLAAQAFRIGNNWINASVFKADDFTPDNPIMRVVGTNTDGTTFDVNVDVRTVDPRNASFIELLALDGYAAANGQPGGFTRSAHGALSSAAVANGQEDISESVDAFTRMDFLSLIARFAELQRENGNMEGFMFLEQILDSLNRHIRNMNMDSQEAKP